MDPCSFELIPGTPLSAVFSGCVHQSTTIEFDDAYLRAIGALPPLAPVRFSSSSPIHHAAALHDSIELPATCEVSDYDADIDVNLREMEKDAKQWPSPEYLKTVQGGLMTKSRRAELVSWMDDFTRYFDLAPGTLHRAVSYVDRVLSQRTLPETDTEHQLQLLGATAVYTAAKYEEQCSTHKLNATAVAGICGLDTTSKEVIAMELVMVETLEYDLSGPTAYTFVEHFMRYAGRGEQDSEVRRLAHHLANRSLYDYSLLQLLPSVVAASAVFLARLILNPNAIDVRQWNEDFEELTGYKPTDIILGIESLYMKNHDSRFDVVPDFLEGQLMDFRFFFRNGAVP
jgi:cyclin A